MTIANVTNDRFVEAKLSNQAALEVFLMGVQRKGYQMACMAVGDQDEALDILQDVMMKLAQNYGTRPEAEWRPLFYRILNNRIMDHHRKRTSRGRWMAWLKPHRDEDGGDELDLIQAAPDLNSPQPDQVLSLDLAGDELVKAVEKLPLRQQQAFMLRAWEGFSVAETAKAMSCSDGSVKTHYSRALKNLRLALEDHYEKR